MLSIHRVLPRARAVHGQRAAIFRDDRWQTYEEVGRRVDALAGGLRRLGIGTGDHVAVLDVNSPEYVECYYAAAQSGFVIVPLNHRLSVPELEYILEDCGARALVVSPDFYPSAEELKASCASLEHVVGLTGGPSGMRTYDSLLTSGEAERPLQVEPDPDDVAAVYYTSGTTGDPKGVCLTYRNLTVSALDTIIGLGLTWSDTWLHAAPLFHLVDAWAVWAAPLLGGRQVTSPSKPEAMAAAAAATRATCTAMPATMLDMLCSSQAPEDHDLSSLRLVMYGGSPTPEAVLDRAGARLGAALYHAYGTTETSGVTTLRRPVPGPRHRDGVESAGQAVANITVGVADDDGHLLEAGNIGEVVVAGPRVMKGYLNKPDETGLALRGPWYHTGDLGYLDPDQSLYIVDRKKDMIITGGENVYPAEVERVIAAMPGIVECAVIGIPHDRWGEAVHAVIVAEPDHELTPADVVQFCRGRLGGYKIPKSVSFRADPLPRNGPGKLAKQRLRAPFWEGRS